MNFSTRNLEVVPAAQAGGKYLDLGVNDNVTVYGIASGLSSAKQTPFLSVTIGKSEDGQLTEKFYMTEKTQERTQERIIHLLVDGLGVDRAAVDDAGEKATSLDDYAARLNKLVPADNKIRVKLTAEEYYNNSGELKVAKRINSKFFAEPMSVSPTRLKYDANSKYDYVKAAVPNDGPAVVAGDDENSLPF